MNDFINEYSFTFSKEKKNTKRRESFDAWRQRAGWSCRIPQSVSFHNPRNQSLLLRALESALSPGSTLPCRSSSDAPPPVDTCETALA